VRGRRTGREQGVKRRARVSLRPGSKRASRFHAPRPENSSHYQPEIAHGRQKERWIYYVPADGYPFFLPDGLPRIKLSGNARFPWFYHCHCHCAGHVGLSLAETVAMG